MKLKERFVGDVRRPITFDGIESVFTARFHLFVYASRTKLRIVDHDGSVEQLAVHIVSLRRT